jgi:cell division protein FtsZ
VLINITGGMDLAIDEVNTISSMIQDAAGDEAEIIFGAVQDGSMSEELRVTVIATGFEKDTDFAPRPETPVRAEFGGARVATARPVARPVPEAVEATPIQRWTPSRPAERKLPNDLDIPTFIRRQMD